MGLLDKLPISTSTSIMEVKDPLMAYLWAILAIGFVAIITRINSSRSTTTETDKDGTRAIPGVAYWLPFIGHISSMALDGHGFAQKVQKQYRDGIFSLNMAGSRHNIVYAPDLVTSLLNSKSSDADGDHLVVKMLHNIFGMPAGVWKHDTVGLADIVGKYKIILSEAGLRDLIGVTERYLRNNIKDLVTGNESVVDMMTWERAANVEIHHAPSGERYMEADLLELLRNFIGHIAVSSFMGSNFLENFPTFLTDLWALDRAFVLMALGLPRWVPIPRVTSAHIARKRMLEQLSAFHRAAQMEHDGKVVEPNWANLEDVSNLIKARNECYRDQNLDMTSRASLDLGLLWGANANANTLTFWLILRLYSDRALLALVREEIAPYVIVVHPTKELATAEPPRIEKFDIAGICGKCPLLKSCYVESLRVDSAPWSLRTAERDFTLQSRVKGSQGWRIKKGDFCHAAHDLHFMDHTVFSDPEMFKPDRHIKYDEDTKEATVDMGSLRAFGGGSSMCKGRAYAYKELMMFTAAIISMWEIEPAKGGKLELPEKKAATAVYGVKNDVRVRFKYRTPDNSPKTDDQVKEKR